MATLRPSLMLKLALFGVVGLVGCRSIRNVGDVIRVEGGAERAREWTQRGIEYNQRGESGQAEESFKKAIRADETHGPAHNNLGHVYFQRGEWKRSAEAFQWAMNFLPGRPEPVNNLGLVLEAAGKLGEAIAHFESAHALMPDSPEYLGNLVRARLRRGDRGADVRKALQSLRFIETRPDWKAWVDEQLALVPGNEALVLTGGEPEAGKINLTPADPNSSSEKTNFLAPIINAPL